MDRYKKVGLLGRGSFGSAVLVRERTGAEADGETANGQLRVIKEIDLARMPQPAQKQARGEAKVLKSLEHPNVVAYVDMFIAHARLCIVMEFADGGDLGAAIKTRRATNHLFPQAEALSIFSQCSRAVGYVHSMRILHRDLKCQNIFLTKTGCVKLGDFGISKVLDSTLCEAMTQIGTPSYLAPEVCDNKPYGTKADIWSLGVAFHETLALEAPFRAENLAALIFRIVQAEPKPLPDTFDKDVRDLVQWMLQKTPEQRPSADELLCQPVLLSVELGQSSPTPRHARKKSPASSPVKGSPAMSPQKGSLASSPPSRSPSIKSARAHAAAAVAGLPTPARASFQSEPGHARDCCSPPSVKAKQKFVEHAHGIMNAIAGRTAAEIRLQEVLQEAAARARRDRRRLQHRVRELSQPAVKTATSASQHAAKTTVDGPSLVAFLEAAAQPQIPTLTTLREVVAHPVAPAAVTLREAEQTERISRHSCMDEALHGGRGTSSPRRPSSARSCRRQHSIDKDYGIAPPATHRGQTRLQTRGGLLGLGLAELSDAGQSASKAASASPAGGRSPLCLAGGLLAGPASIRNSAPPTTPVASRGSTAAPCQTPRPLGGRTPFGTPGSGALGETLFRSCRASPSPDLNSAEDPIASPTGLSSSKSPTAYEDRFTGRKTPKALFSSRKSPKMLGPSFHLDRSPEPCSSCFASELLEGTFVDFVEYDSLAYTQITEMSR